MPFDPAQPANNSALSSQVMRDQLQALFNLINSIVTVTAAQVDGVTTVNPADPAAVTLSVIGNTLHFSFAIPRGNDGTQGIPGNDGGTGPQGPPFANAIVDAVNTLQPGHPLARAATPVGLFRHHSPFTIHDPPYFFPGAGFHCHCSLKKPASATPPGAREVRGWLRSMTAQSGSLATWRALFR